ncbi:MAG: AAA family ATPase, partial [Gemmataceae bacterium]
AYKDIFDLFLAMLGDGRLTEQGSGEQANFKETIVMMTGNAEFEAVMRISKQVTDPVERSNAVKQHLVSAKLFRPEIMDRLDRVYVFHPLSSEQLIEIAVLKSTKLAEQYGLTLASLDEEIIVDLALKLDRLQKPNKVREMMRLLEETLGEPLLQAQEQRLSAVRAEYDAEGRVVVRRFTEGDLV